MKREREEQRRKQEEKEYDEWYKNYIIGDSGIWVGNGVDEQYVINVNVRDKSIITKILFIVSWKLVI